MVRPSFVCASVLVCVACAPEPDDGLVGESASFGTGTTELPSTGFTAEGDGDGDSTGDGDGDSTGDGDGDPTGDGDGDGEGDGDGDSAGDGDGDPTGDGDGDPPLPPPGDRPVIYELVVRHFGNTNQTRAADASLAENGVGKFVDIDELAVAGLAELGVTHVWLAGVLRQATLTNYQGYGMPADDPDVVRGRAGWLHAVRDYYDVSPDYALDPTLRMEEFEALVARLHEAQLRVLIDLIPNQVARSYASVVEPDADFGLDDSQSFFFQASNNFFYLPGDGLSLQKPPGWNPPNFVFDGMFAPENGNPGAFPKVTGNDLVSPSPAATDWYDTIKLNWGYDFVDELGDYQPMPDTWTKFDAILAHWQARGVDGFRVERADAVPIEAWTWLIEQARARDAEVEFFGAADSVRDELLAAGFDAVSYDEAHDELKRLYQGNASQQSYADVMFAVSNEQRPFFMAHLERHDERRLASPVVQGPPGESGFGSKEAGYQLAPVAFLSGGAPIVVYNGQEVGETGQGFEGFEGDDGRTSLHDYWSLEELSKWVNDGAYDGGGLAADQLQLRNFYADLLRLSQDAAALGSGYWGLEYFNNPGMFGDCPAGFYSYARFEPGAGRLMVVVANFEPFGPSSGPVRLPQGLLDAAGLAGMVEVRRVLDRSGAVDVVVGSGDAASLGQEGFSIEVEDQTTHVFLVE